MSAAFFLKTHLLIATGLLVCFTLDATAVATPTPTSTPIGQTISVPLDYTNPNSGRADLSYELGAPFDRSKQTVFLIADAQQFYVTKGRAVELENKMFGPDFNVVCILNRGATHDFVSASVDANGNPDWAKAWRIFNSEQFLNDIEAVRKALLGEDGKILLYGASGGGLLVHQYLARYSEHVTRAFTAAAVNPFLDRELGLNSDHFWDEIGASDPSLQPLLKKVLAEHTNDRAKLVMTIQRQNFFVPIPKLPSARAELIHALAKNDQKFYEAAQKQYQVPEVSAFFSSKDGIPVRVRLYEFWQPLQAESRLHGDGFYPDLENQYDFAKPLVELQQAGKIPVPAFDFRALHRVTAEVFVLAGRNDHTVDYRSQIALAACYPNVKLLIVKDNHEFDEVAADGSLNRLRRSFLRDGLGSSQCSDALKAIEPHRWIE